MFLVVGILFFLAWLAAFFFFAIAHVITYIFLLIAIILIIIHFILAFRRRTRGKDEPGKTQV